MLSFASNQPLNPRSLPVMAHLEPLKNLLSVGTASNIEIVLSDQSGGAPISVDTTQFGSAIMNLVFNARDSMPDGGKISIETGIVRYGELDAGRPESRAAELQSDTEPSRAEVREAGRVAAPNAAGRILQPSILSTEASAQLNPETELVRIEVRDTGHGMSLEVLKHAFEPFFTTKQDGAGSGMGLAMVYGFSRQSGGFVEIESFVGVGTSVRMYIPKARSVDASASSIGADVAPSDFKRSILVVEDDRNVARTICEMLRAMGHAARDCDNASDAMAILERHPGIDTVITDVMLRGQTTGIVLRTSILERFPHIRVVCVSGYQDQKSRVARAAHPDIDFMPKPFDYNDLARLLAQRPSSDKPTGTNRT
ncbi:MAG: response regulator [Hyphomicrobiales bacterium]|nr:response regulator [Hyphomicrobiales bacterium]